MSVERRINKENSQTIKMTNVEYKTEKLSATNYNTWKTIVTSQLKGQDLWDYVMTSKMEGAPEKIGNEKAKTLIYLSMEAQQIASTGVCESAYDLWKKISENHEGAQTNLRSSSLSEFLGIKYRKNESIIQYAGRYETTLGKVESTNYKVDETTKLWAFSNSLPSHLKQTVQMFTMAKPDGSVNELISQLKIQHHQEGNNNQDAAYYMQSRNYQPNNKLEQNTSCTYCKKSGHIWRECRKLKADKERKKKFSQRAEINSNAPQQSIFPKDTFPRQQKNQTNDKRPSGAFSIKKHEFSEGKYSWIIDSGASSHMTPHKDLLTNYEEYNSPHKIYLGDGKSLEVYGEGNMFFHSSEFEGTLLNVLWVPQLSENLFSIGKAIEQDCRVEFWGVVR